MEVREREAGGIQEWYGMARKFCWRQQNRNIALFKIANFVPMAVLGNVGWHKIPLVLHCLTRMLPKGPWEQAPG